MAGKHLPIKDLSPKFPVLGLLYFQPMHGYDLHRKLASDLHEIWRISQSQVYALVKRLEAEGLVQTNLETQEKRPDRCILSLTENGKTAFFDWLNTSTQSSSRAIRMEFLTRIYFASHMGKPVVEQIIKEQAVATQNDLQQMHERYDSMTHEEVFSRLGLELRMRQIISILDWLESCELTQSLPIHK
ncbi:MAG: helix-turn-helix transcriptional regulator [Anaerolineales bacterium]|nr:helix-turn-helix transcriptional regulator [Anaerolineales bacterium]